MVLYRMLSLRRHFFTACSACVNRIWIGMLWMPIPFRIRQNGSDPTRIHNTGCHAGHHLILYRLYVILQAIIWLSRWLSSKVLSCWLSHWLSWFSCKLSTWLCHYGVMQAIMMGCQSRGGSPMSDAGYATSAGTHSIGLALETISWYPYSGTKIKLSDILAFNFL